MAARCLKLCIYLGATESKYLNSQFTSDVCKTLASLTVKFVLVNFAYGRVYVFKKTLKCYGLILRILLTVSDRELEYLLYC